MMTDERPYRRIDPSDESAVLSVRLPRRLVARLERDAAKEGKSRSEHVRELLDAIFDGWEPPA